MKFGEKVRDLRKKHSLTQDELAQCLGINKRTIIGWERDGRYPRSIEMLEKMADIFHVPLTYLQPDQSLCAISSLDFLVAAYSDTGLSTLSSVLYGTFLLLPYTEELDA